jgi:hypothetical protein
VAAIVLDALPRTRDPTEPSRESVAITG